MSEHAISSDQAGLRLDVWLAQNLTACSRARWKELIASHHVVVNGELRKPNYILREGDCVRALIPEAKPSALEPEDIPLDVLFEDEHFLVLNKQAGMVVHPAPGHDSGTLVHALLAHCRDLRGIGGEMRPGIVHRLDKDTSGVLVVAKQDDSMRSLVEQFKGRHTDKRYAALVWGVPSPASGTVETLIGRSVHNRKKMSAKPKHGREALTHYSVVEAFDACALLNISIETGRTHQIRVHMSHIGHPVVGDREYGRARNVKWPTTPRRQMLHAAELSLDHPATGKRMTFQAPCPPDFEEIVTMLRAL